MTAMDSSKPRDAHGQAFSARMQKSPSKGGWTYVVMPDSRELQCSIRYRTRSFRQAAPSHGRSGADESPICLPRRVASLSTVAGNAARGETVSLDRGRLAVPTQGGVLSSPHGYAAPHGTRDHRITRRCWCWPGFSASRSRWRAFRLFQDAHGIPNHQQRQ